MALGPLLRSLRKAAGVRQADLADACGIDFTYVSKIEHDAVAPPSEETIRCFARELAADPDELLTASGRTVGVPYAAFALAKRLPQIAADIRTCYAHPNDMERLDGHANVLDALASLLLYGGN